MWVNKHKPDLEHIPHDTKKITDFVTNYKKQKKKALLLHGPTGTGKTATVHALARKLGLELIEINASDDRNAAEIKTRVGNAIKQQSLFSQGKIILIDEINGIAGTDRGGVAALADLIKQSQFPIILTANDPWESKFNSLRTKSQLIEFKTIEITEMTKALQRILDKEKLQADEIVMKTLSRRSGGDLRGAITDLQTLAQAGTLTLQSLETLYEREHSESIMQALVKILKSTDPAVAVSALDLVDEDIDECFLWIDENMPKEYKNPDDLARAYEALSKADVYRGRIRRWQYWRYLAYVNVLITAGVATAKNKKSTSFVTYSRTKRLLKHWMANQKYAKRKQIAQKIATATHCSSRKALQETLPYLQRIFKNNQEQITKELDLEEEEAEWLAK